MANICIYDVSETEQTSFAVLHEENDVQLIQEPLTIDTVNPEAEIISVFVTSNISGAIIEKMPKLKLIACRSTGFNNVNLDAAKHHGITVVNVPTYGEHTVAEYTIGMLLALTRKIVTSSLQIARNNLDHSQLHGCDINGKTLGVIGAGRIGKNVIATAQALGMKVIVCDPFLNDPLAEELGVESVSLDDLAEKADVITLHAPLTKENNHLINSQLLAKMKNGVYIINTARGELIDTAALIEALKSGKVAGAGLDVLEDEKLMDIDEEELLLKKGAKTKAVLEHVIANTLLLRLPNIIVTSHNAYNTLEAIGRINTTTRDNIISYLAGDPQNVVGV